MVLDWLAREGWMVFNWWLLAALAGAAALPLCLQLLHNLPDRGYTLARAAGILLTAFVYWLATSLGFLRNDVGGIALAWMAVLLLSVVVYVRLGPPDLRAWWRDNRAVVIAAEVLFALLFLAWAIVRAHQHSLAGTEKPMDLAFLSSSVRSLYYPPEDPWLAGYAISYYYFGYIMGGMFTTVSGVVTTIGYNLWTALLFALTGLTTFGVVTNLVRSRRRADLPPRMSVSIVSGLFGVLLMIVVGNYQVPFVEIPYASGAATPEYLEFWDLNVRQEPLPVTRTDLGSLSIDYFRSARVLNDRNLQSMVDAGQASEREEVINEFPQFSFLLADNHPHVMALPFTLLALGLAVNVLLAARRPTVGETAFYGVAVGSLVFLNTWDTPAYLMAIVGADALRRLRNGRFSQRDWGEMAVFLVALLAITLLAYLPFLVGFRSQLGGVLPNIIHPTPFQQYFLAFGALVPLVALYLVVEASRRGMNWRLGLTSVLALLLLLLGLLLLLVLVGARSPQIATSVQRFVDASGGWDVVLPEVLAKRASHIATTVILALGLVLVIARIFPRGVLHTSAEPTPPAYPLATGFAVMLIGAGLMLTLIPEFVYLRDSFSTRMNTIFKFYYQAWTLFTIAVSYGLYAMLTDVRALPVRGLVSALTLITVGLGLVYPVFGIHERANKSGTRILIDDQQALTLDGWRTVVNQEDYEVLMCLREIVGQSPVVIAEATGGSYDFWGPGTGAGRTGALTGMPTLLGWIFHQSQWRGADFGTAVGTREDDLRRLYTDLRLETVQPIIEKYGIDYILYGAVERDPGYYGSPGEEKFLAAYDAVCESGNSRVYRTAQTRQE